MCVYIILLVSYTLLLCDLEAISPWTIIYVFCVSCCPRWGYSYIENDTTELWINYRWGNSWRGSAVEWLLECSCWPYIFFGLLFPVIPWKNVNLWTLNIAHWHSCFQLKIFLTQICQWWTYWPSVQLKTNLLKLTYSCSCLCLLFFIDSKHLACY